MMNMAAAFLFSGLTSSKAKLVLQTHTHRNTHREDVATQAARDRVLSSTASTCSAFRSDVTARFSSSSLTGMDWHSVVKVLALLWISQALVWPPLPTQHSCLDLLIHPMVLCSPAAPASETCKQSHRYSTLVDPQNYQCGLCSPQTPARSQSHSLPSSAWELWVNAPAYLIHTPQFLHGPSISIWRFLALSLFIPCLTACVPVFLSLPLSDYFPLEEVLDWIKLTKLILSTCPTQTGCDVGDSDSLSSVICSQPTQRLGRHLVS